MKNRSILILAGGSTDPAALGVTLEGARAANARVSILVVGLVPNAPTYAYGLDFYGAPPLAEDWREEVEVTRTRLTRAATGFEKRVSEDGVSGEVAVLCADSVTVQRMVQRMALTADMLLVSDDLRQDKALFDLAVQTGLFLAPSGVMLNGLSSPSALTQPRIFVAWKAGLPAARALHAARPLLDVAQEITIGVFDTVMSEGRDGENPGSDVARWLSHQGYKVAVQHYPSGGKEIGACILMRASETGADLVVMGAYGHSRMREMVFGGTTRTMIEQSAMPVLSAH